MKLVGGSIPKKNHYTLGEKLGQGVFGDVFAGRREGFEEELAIKRMKGSPYTVQTRLTFSWTTKVYLVGRGGRPGPFCRTCPRTRFVFRQVAALLLASLQRMPSRRKERPQLRHCGGLCPREVQGASAHRTGARRLLGVRLCGRRPSEDNRRLGDETHRYWFSRVAPADDSGQAGRPRWFWTLGHSRHGFGLVRSRVVRPLLGPLTW